MSYRLFHPYRNTYPPASKWNGIVFRLREQVRREAEQWPWKLLLMALMTTVAALMCKAI